MSALASADGQQHKVLQVLRPLTVVLHVSPAGK